MPNTETALRRCLFRAWMLFLTGAALMALLCLCAPDLLDADTPTMLLYILLAGSAFGGWYLVGSWIIRQVEERIIRSSVFDNVLYGAFILFSPFCCLPMMIAGLRKLHKLRAAEPVQHDQ